MKRLYRYVVTFQGNSIYGICSIKAKNKEEAKARFYERRSNGEYKVVSIIRKKAAPKQPNTEKNQ